MKTSLVLELQHLCTEPDSDVGALLRKALVIATKLKRDDFKAWTESELNGYAKGAVPEYRKLRAEIRLKNPYRGLIPVHFPNQETHDLFTWISVRDPVANIISLVQGQTSNKTQPVFPLSPREEAFLLQNQNGLDLPPVRTVAINQLEGIVEAVRTAILEWTLRLEADGILGEGLTFSNEEKEKAMSSQNIRIENFQGILGDVSHSTVSQNLNLNIQKGDFDSLARYLEGLGIEKTETEELKKVIAQESAPQGENANFGPKVSSWIGGMLAKAANGSWKVGIGVAANLLTEAIKAYY